MTDTTDSFMRQKGGIYSTQSLVLKYMAHSKCLSVRSIPPILLKVGIPNSGFILGCKVLCTIFGVTVTLTSGLGPSIS